MEDLVTWLRAQLDDDERAYDRALEGYPIVNRATLAYIGRWPSELDAKRRILDLYEHRVESMRRYPNQGNANAMAALQEAVRLLALPHADRPGYRPEWRP